MNNRIVKKNLCKSVESVDESFFRVNSCHSWVVFVSGFEFRIYYSFKY